MYAFYFKLSYICTADSDTVPPTPTDACIIFGKSKSLVRSKLKGLLSEWTEKAKSYQVDQIQQVPVAKVWFPLSGKKVIAWPQLSKRVRLEEKAIAHAEFTGELEDDVGCVFITRVPAIQSASAPTFFHRTPRLEEARSNHQRSWVVIAVGYDEAFHPIGHAMLIEGSSLEAAAERYEEYFGLPSHQVCFEWCPPTFLAR